MTLHIRTALFTLAALLMLLAWQEISYQSTEYKDVLWAMGQEICP